MNPPKASRPNPSPRGNDNQDIDSGANRARRPACITAKWAGDSVRFGRLGSDVRSLTRPPCLPGHRSLSRRCTRPQCSRLRGWSFETHGRTSTFCALHCRSSRDSSVSIVSSSIHLLFWVLPCYFQAISPKYRLCSNVVMSSTKKTTPDETMTVSLRLKKSLVSDLDKLAAIENRTRANLIETLVIKALKEDAR